MKTKIYILTLIRRLSLPVLMILTGLSIQAFYLEANASERQTDSITPSNAKPFHRCQRQWRYRCGSNNDAAANSIESDVIVIKLNDEPKFRRCGRLWQSNCAGNRSKSQTSVSFVRQEYVINDQHTFDEQNHPATKTDSLENEPHYRRCGRLWQIRCSGRR